MSLRQSQLLADPDCGHRRFVFGAVWYGTLSRQWMAARGVSAADMEKAKAEMGAMLRALSHHLRGAC